MYCPNCGNVIPEGSTFCSNCGCKIVNNQVKQENSNNLDSNSKSNKNSYWLIPLFLFLTYFACGIIQIFVYKNNVLNSLLLIIKMLSAFLVFPSLILALILTLTSKK